MELEGQEYDVEIKWGKELVTLKIDPNQTLEFFKSQIYSLTSVKPENQKLMFKGKFLKENDSTLDKIGLVNKSKLVMMGKAEDQVVNLGQQVAENKQVFIEDLTPQQKAEYFKNNFGKIIPIGLINCGNTCYVNASMQIMFRIKELKSAIQNYQAKNYQNPNEKLILATKDMFQKLEKQGHSFAPEQFLSAMFQNFPQFKEMEPNGHGYRQQDADEYFQYYLTAIGQYLMKSDSENLVHDLFEYSLEIQFKNTEDEEEQSDKRTEYLNKLSCIIDNQMNPVNNLVDGIQCALQEDVEKYSENLQRNSIWKKQSKLSSLPKYLVVQKIRFVWKERDIGTNTEAGKAKLLRAVSFPKILDLFTFCNEDLQKQLDPIRKSEIQRGEEKKQQEKDEFEIYKQKYPDINDTMILNKKFKQEKKKQEVKEEDEILWRDFDEGEMTGNYQLIGVITHKGRSTNSGHYVAWCHQSGSDWIKCDDDEISEVQLNDILALNGGGDWHTAYYLIYRRLQFKQNFIQQVFIYSYQLLKQQISQHQFLFKIILPLNYSSLFELIQKSSLIRVQRQLQNTL